MSNKIGIFFCALPSVRHALSVTEHAPIHSKSLYKNMERCRRGANNVHPLGWARSNGKDPKFVTEI